MDFNFFLLLNCIIAYPTTSHGIWRFIPHRGGYIPRSEASFIKNKRANKVMVLELQQANPEDVQLHINSKELRIMRYLITTGLCVPRTSLSLVVDSKKCLVDLRG